jgi:methionyl aminopeptidase
MAKIKSKEDIARLRIAGEHLASVLDAVAAAVVPGVTFATLEAITRAEIEKRNAKPAFLGYQPQGAPRPFPAALCVALNDTVVHGIPTESETVLAEGDIIGIDTGLWFEGVVVDSGRTVGVGVIDPVAQQLLSATKDALMSGISAARAGNTTGDIGHAVERIIDKTPFSIVEELAGHGVGHMIHEPPSIPNFGRRGEGVRLVPGMVLAIEPMVNEGSRHVVFLGDGYTVRTKDGKRSAHFEHTVLITDADSEILTQNLGR